MSEQISTIIAIRALSDEGARLLDRQLGWLNPLPQHLTGVFERIKFAIERAEYVAERAGTGTADPEELAALLRELQIVAAQLARDQSQRPLR